MIARQIQIPLRVLPPRAIALAEPHTPTTIREGTLSFARVPPSRREALAGQCPPPDSRSQRQFGESAFSPSRKKVESHEAPHQLGSDDRAGHARRKPWWGHLMPTSSRAVGKKLPLPTEREYSEKFSPVVENLNLHKLSKATGRSVETMKAWRARRAFPNGASLINAAKAFPQIKAWLLAELDANDGYEPLSADVTGKLQAIERLANTPGPAGEFARAFLTEMHKPRA